MVCAEYHTLHRQKVEVKPRMKILLIRPKPDPETIGLQHVMICEPLELEYVGAVLEDGHDVVLIDMILEKRSLEDIIKVEKPDMVCMTGYISHVHVLKSLATRIKGIDGSIKVVVGGSHAEVVPEDYVDGNFDYILAANALKHIRAIADGAPRPRLIVEPKDRSFDAPHPARHLSARYRKDYYYMFHNPCSLIKTSFGCPYSCAFCFCKEITDGAYFTRDVDDVIGELKSIPEREIYIVDDDFLFDQKRLETFCDRIHDEGLDKRFLVYGRADFIAKHPETMRKLKDAGLRAVIVGLESYADDELDMYQKNSDTALSLKCLEVLKTLDIECYGTFIIGLDWTRENFKALYRFIVRSGIQFVNLQPLTPMKGTALYETYAEQFIVPPEDFARWDMAHLVVQPTHLSIRRYYFEIVKLYYKTTVRPSMVVRALRKYPFMENLKLTVGANRVMWQYIKRIIKGKP